MTRNIIQLGFFLCVLSMCVVWMDGSSAFVSAAVTEKAAKPLEKAFPHSQKCKRCHIRVFEEWEASAQSRSIVSSAFRVTLDRFLSSGPEKEASMCLRCHAPHILEYTHQSKMFVEEVKSKDPQIDGVGCAQCHLIKDINSDVHPPLPTYQLEKTVFGGYKKPAENLAHQSEHSELYQSSAFCVTCHDSLPKGATMGSLPDWMGNWKESQAEKSGKTCQACHMPGAFGESANGERNRKIANHSFPGRFGKVRAKAVELDFTTNVQGETSTVDVTIQSLVPHNLPMPHPGWYRVVVDLTVLGKNLRKVHNDQRYYERVYGDKNGKKTVLDFEAVKVLSDTLLKPEEKRVESFTFPTPSNAPSMDVIVTLTYAPIHGPEEFVQAVEDESNLGTKDRAFQAVEVFKKKVNVPLNK
ncbi:MAG: cytochrome c family protein [Nitrospirales bacterium]|nr:MAG: cytochrome c family protein [Nitrospirales bacterium]